MMRPPGPPFADVFDVLPTPYMVLDRQLRYVAVNRAYETAVLRTRDQLLGLVVFEAFPDESENGRRIRASLERVFETGQTDTLAFIPYQIALPETLGGGMEQRYWTATHTPVRGADGTVAYVVQNTIDVTEIVRLKETASLPFRAVPSELALLRNAQDREQAYQDQVSESAEFRRLFLQAPGLIAIMTGPEHVVTFANEAYQRFVGREDLVGRPIREALPELVTQGFVDLMDRVVKGGEPIAGEGIRVLLGRRPGEEMREAYCDFTFTPIRSVEGEVNGIFVQGTDRTDSIRARRRQRRLMDELNHRVKNTLATVQSLARQSFRNIRDPEEARYAFEARILALSKTHNVLSDRQWEAASLPVLVAQELAEFDPERVSVKGPDIPLNANAAIALTMVFHELAANARRHGAYSRRGGRIGLTWAREESEAGPRLHVRWRETGLAVPPVLSNGFGIRVIRRIVTGELEGTLSLDAVADGIMCDFTVPIAGVEDFEGSFQSTGA
ncbi:PAS domain-containing protein [Aurantimonas sp. Leaf443]|uniref:sensor histidine kinase n=1 Tax=Aurantimonas sp. Leaf443 TaxID=1736378 RepID=UPI0006F9B21A|nr:PAS domain-containing protein [Aurantimonas sp. Leaf443]KQT86036.1 histidine kinase [Aurantimonas sp. Leaf443]